MVITSMLEFYYGLNRGNLGCLTRTKFLTVTFYSDQQMTSGLNSFTKIQSDVSTYGGQLLGKVECQGPKSCSSGTP